MFKRSLIAILLGLFGFSAGTTVYAEISCDLCGKPITGQYMQYKTSTKSMNVCASCNQRYPHCDACKIPVAPGQIINQKGERLCADCARKAIYCKLCGKRVAGQYFKAGETGEVYCSNCYANTPRCKVCGKPTPQNLIDLASGACAECSKKIPKCVLCGKGITGTYYTIPTIEGKYCEDCFLHKEKCYICGVPMKDTWWEFPDGRKICDSCNSRAVIDEQKIRDIMTEVELLVPKVVGIKAEQPYTLKVETLNKDSFTKALAAKKGQATSSPLYGSELGLFRKLNGSTEIFLLYGLPPEVIYETAAHEYTHAWQAENSSPSQSPEIREGFAQWVAAQILKAKGYKQTLEKLEIRDDRPYGTGYQLIKRYAERLGKDGIIDYAKKAVR